QLRQRPGQLALVSADTGPLPCRGGAPGWWPSGVLGPRWRGARVFGHVWEGWPNTPAPQRASIPGLVPPCAGIWPDGQMCGPIPPAARGAPPPPTPRGGPVQDDRQNPRTRLPVGRDLCWQLGFPPATLWVDPRAGRRVRRHWRGDAASRAVPAAAL